VSVPLTLLGLLEREPSYGYDLKRDYDAHFGWGRSIADRRTRLLTESIL